MQTYKKRERIVRLDERLKEYRQGAEKRRIAAEEAAAAVKKRRKFIGQSRKLAAKVARG